MFLDDNDNTDLTR